MDRRKKQSMIQTYRQFMETGLGIRKSGSLYKIVDERIVGFGTAIDEKIRGIKELKKLLHNQEQQSKGIKVKWRSKPVSHYTSPDENTAIFADDLYLIIYAGKETVKMYMRFSVVLNYVDSQWKVIHWHGSKPENVESEKDTFGIDSWKQRAAELEKLVEEKTIDLVAKNHELEIETALEKVRAQTLGMHKPGDLLKVCEVVFKELLALGVSEIRNALIHTFNDERKFLTDYDYSDSTGGAITIIPYGGNSVIDNFLKQIKKSDKAFVEIVVKGQELSAWRRFRKKVGQHDDPRLKKASALCYYVHSIGQASIGISTFGPVSEDKKQLLKRFRNVFDFAYRRYIDVKNAEAQAREAQIEVAVERVRAKALAMHKSEEIHEVVRTLRNELFGLKLEGIIGATICLKQADGQVRLWDITDVETTGRYGWDIVFNMSEIDPRLWVKKIWSSKKQIVSTEQDSNDLKRTLKWLSKFDKKTADEITRLLKNSNITHGWHRAVKLVNGVLITDFINEPPAEIGSILLKIGAAFDLAYKRFLDLQKAEAQTREAQIEASLERVRSRTMAMHQTSELQEVIHTVHKELLNLNLSIFGGSFVVINDDVGPELRCWGAGGTANTSHEVLVPHFNMPFCTNLIKGIKKGPGFFTEEFSQKEKKEYFTKLFKHKPWSVLSNAQKKETLSSEGGYTRSVAVSKHTTIFIINHNGRKFTEDENDILKRFAKVFEQTYTRFLDLQKAEAQTREAQIEAALERVRASSMAMHRSADLHEVVKTMTDQLLGVGLKFNFAMFAKNHPDRSLELWIFTPDQPYPSRIDVPFIDHRVFTGIPEKVAEFYTDIYDCKEKNIFFRHFFENTTAKNTPAERKQWVYDRPGLARTLCPTKNMWFVVGVYDIIPFNNEENIIIRRFANVFEQFYTRFLDLQKAEAQAREAQIEAGLERVRSRGMAMQTSEELAALIGTLFTELTKLDLILTRCVVWIIDHKTNDAVWWMANSEDPTHPMNYFIPYHESPPWLAFMNEWKKRTLKWVYDLKGQTKKDWDDHLFSKTGLAKMPKFISDSMRAPERILLSASFNNFGGMNVASLEPLSDEHFNILLRFAKVFDLTYTRFNDLKQAEAQAMEARIEAALERVRSKTMAMHSSNELDIIIKTVYSELKKLDVIFELCFIMIFDEHKGATWWMGSPDDDLFHEGFYVQYHTHEPHLAYLQGWEERQQKWEYWLGGQVKKDWDEFIFSKTELSNLPSIAIQSMKSFDAANLSASFENFGCMTTGGRETLSDESFNILSRFAKVFDLSYTRFKDLQKAEAQAREAQIELGLERVRARAMAMQRSDEVKELIATMSSELGKLDIILDRCFIIIYDPHTLGSTWWMANPETPTEPIGLEVQYHEHVPYLEHLEAWRHRKVKWEYILEGKVKEAWDQFLFVETGLSQLPPPVIENMRSKRKVYLSSSFNNFGYLTLATLDPLTDQQFDIMLRFARVFDLTYTRFNDLKQAEAQARESQIQLALERVRARTMAMQHSRELSETAELLFQQFKSLGEEMMQMTIGIMNEQEGEIEFSVTDWGGSGAGVNRSFKLSIEEPTLMSKMYKAWKEQKRSVVVDLTGKELEDWLSYRNKMGGIEVRSEDTAGRRVINIAPFSKGLISYSSPLPRPVEVIQVLERFAALFDQTYTRFLDLQKAEAQAKEAQIETALERVRAVAMAMRKPEELMQISEIIYKQLIVLGFSNVRNVQIAIDDDARQIYNGVEYSEYYQNKLVNIPYDSSRMFREIVDEMKRSTDAFYQKEIKGNEFEAWRNWRMGVDNRNHPDLATASSMCFYLHSVGAGMLGISTFDPISNDHLDILRRFKNVFELSYRRYIDIEKAETQAKEAQIELALERVRARTMAMHKSEELAETAQVLFHQLEELGGIPDRIAIGIADEHRGMVDYWSTDQSGSHIDKQFHARLNERTVLSKTYQAWKENKKSLVVDLHGDDVIEWLKFAREEMGVPVRDDQIKNRRVHTFTFFSHGWILVTTHEPQSAETIQILERFASVFNLTYRRFLDLKTAEAQANEARIEISLERIRARALAMHKSDELIEVAKVLWEQMTLLGQRELEASAVHLYEVDSDYIHSYRAVSIGPDANTKLTFGHMAIPKNSCELVKEWLENFYTDANEYTIELSGAKQDEWYEVLFKLAPDVGVSMHQKDDIHEKRYYKFSKFSGGALLMITKQLPSEEVTYLQRRAAVVFDLAYRRFSDLQKAEAQAKEARIEISLERIRARALAMHKSDELMEVAIVMREQMAVLGQPDLEASVVHLYEEDPDHVLSWRAFRMEHEAHKEIARGHMPIPKNSCEFIRECLDKFYGDLQEYTIEVSGTKQDELYDVMARLAPDVVNSMRQMNSLHEKRYYRFSKFSGGALVMVSKQEPAAEAIYLQNRAAVVFDLAYRRFLDLQKAEAQAREAQIEAALERVRSKAMAMHKTEDLQPAVAIVFEELEKLDLGVLRCGISVLNKEKRTGDVWVTSTTEHGSAVQVSGDESFDIHPLLHGAFEAWLRQEDFYYVLEGNDLTNYYKAIRIAQFRLPESQLISSGTEEKKQHCNVAVYHAGGLFAFRDAEFSDEAKKVMKRFANVFDLTYKRFLDIQKAEAQAREAQIEASLERVRSKTMAMHNSNDVGDTVAAMFSEFVNLGIYTNRCGILIFDDNNSAEVWTARSNAEGKTNLIIGKLNLVAHNLLSSAYESWKEKKSFHRYDLLGDDMARYYEAINRSEYYPVKFDLNKLPSKETHSDFFFSEGAVFAFTSEPIAEEHSKIFKRFAGVFGQTYRRYLDLQKAEAQAREAQIEAGLERVRARTMAMHSSEDVSAATATMFSELEKLGIENLRGGITIISPDHTQEVWGVTNLPNGKTIRSIGVFDMRLHPLWRDLYEHQEGNESYRYYRLAGKDKEDYIAILNATPNYLSQPIKDFPDVHVQSYFFGGGAIWTNSLVPHTEEQKQTMKRFASVFSLTFRRYQDLRKAEAQAKEATIEAALEKVRGKAMAMHNSNDLSITASMVITELKKLGIKPIRCGVGILNKETHKAQLYTATSSPEGDSLSVVGWVQLEKHPVLEKIYQTWIDGEDYFPELSGDSRKAYYQQLLSGLSVPLPNFDESQKHYGYFFSVSVGCLYAWSDVKYNDDEIKILKRFASIIDLTFRRYFELQKSEANAREAVKQAALDRVRADIASMRTINDLDRITPLIWNELTTLNIAFIRCGVFIMDESQQLIHTFLSTPDGKAIAAFHLPYDTPGNISKVIDNWRVKKIYIDHWGEEEFVQFADILMKQGALSSREQYLKTIPRGGFKLHFFPFLQGMLYVGNTEQLNDEQIELIQHVADAFSTAYARYEDFNKLEAAKQQVENTLTDLKQAQTQLVQSEKMASLGELTAGIAHEIQNPLNFVNNFSDVSNELLEEMKNELEKGNKEDAIAIVEDVKQNLEKILHHGKRADAIVKGMLQHSRTSSGQKEMTDINILADEYLRLAYHGLRAKDKSFNAKFETHFDNNIEKINVIPQDIGRVILNLINNAFYTVTEKNKKNENGYEPTVTITTLKDNGRIEIKVRDNGNGIPQKVLDKIFQPFFTTKPTGQGTGLGLSLAYDIITKGHAGELKVETKEGEGSEFIIQLPAN